MVDLPRMREFPSDHPGPSPLAGETVVFAGRLWSIRGRDARAAVERLGAACDEDVTARTTMVVVGGDTWPDGVPSAEALAADARPAAQKLRRALQVAAGQPGRPRLVHERAFCGIVGALDRLDARSHYYGQKDILAMYPRLREDHLRYLQKWGFIRPAFRNDIDHWFAFTDLTTLRQLHTSLQGGGTFRAVLRDMQAARTGQLAFDFRLDAHQARIVELRPRRRMAQSQDTAPQMSQRSQLEAWASDEATRTSTTRGAERPLSTAEHYFLMGSLLDDGTAERMEDAARAYRRALEHDPDLVAAIINLANIRYSNEELVEAQALYERAIGLDPTYFEAYFNLGNIHHDRGRYIDAEACYREALGLNAGYADAHFYLAVTLEKMGRSSDARAHWQAYQRLAPAGEWIDLAREFSD